MTEINIKKLFQIANPNRTLNLTNKDDEKYYIDFSSVRGHDVISKLSRTITLSEDQPTCQLFTGHIGCGKTTELSTLQDKLKKKGYHVIYFESSQYLDIGDLDVSDILLVIAQQITKSLEAENVKLQPSHFNELIQEVANLLNSDVKGLKLKIPGLKILGGDVGEIGITQKEEQCSISFGIGEIITKAKDSKHIRSLLRGYFEPRIKNIIDALNKEVIEPARQQLKEKGKSGLVIIIDNLDRIDNKERTNGRNQPEYLFVDRGDQLNKLECHVIYTIPLVLTFSNEQNSLSNRFGSDPYVLPMVRVKEKDGSNCLEGLKLMKQMILKLAFPEEKEELLQNKYIKQLFETNAFDYICEMSGGHVRNLLVSFHSCLKEDDPPFSKSQVEQVIRRKRNDLKKGITDDEWDLLKKVNTNQEVCGEEQYKILLRSLFVFEYQNDDGTTWFAINPVLRDLPQLKD